MSRAPSGGDSAARLTPSRTAATAASPPAPRAARRSAGRTATAPAHAPRAARAGSARRSISNEVKPQRSHQRDLVEQHVADRAQFAGEAEALAQAVRRRRTRGRRRIWRSSARRAGARAASGNCAGASLPATIATPTGSARAPSASRSALQRAKETMIAPAGGIGCGVVERRPGVFGEAAVAPQRHQISCPGAQRLGVDAALGLAASAPAAGARIFARPAPRWCRAGSRSRDSPWRPADAAAGRPRGCRRGCRWRSSRPAD